MRGKRSKSKTRIFVRQQFKMLTLFFPALLVAAEIVLIYRLLQHPTLPRFLAVLVTPYAVPLALFRLHQAILPIREGASFFGIDYYNPWLTGFRLQLIFITFPFLERLLILVPGLFSVWLRLWGSRIGKGVMWTPHIEICDRSHLDVGDHVFFGNKCYLSPHVVKRLEEKKFLLYFKKIVIGEGAFIGAGSRLGSGAVIESGVQLPLLTDVSVGVRVTQAAVDSAQTNGLSRSIGKEPQNA